MILYHILVYILYLIERFSLVQCLLSCRGHLDLASLTTHRTPVLIHPASLFCAHTHTHTQIFGCCPCTGQTTYKDYKQHNANRLSLKVDIQLYLAEWSPFVFVSLQTMHNFEYLKLLGKGTFGKVILVTR